MSEHHPEDVNGDDHVSEEELMMHLEFKRKKIEDEDVFDKDTCTQWLRNYISDYEFKLSSRE